MNQKNKNRISQLTTLTSGAFLGVVAVAAVMLLSGPQPTSVQASSHCGMDICLSKSASFTISAIATAPSVDSFSFSSSEIDPGPTPPQLHIDDVQSGVAEKLVWNTTNADTVTASSNDLGANPDWTGTKAQDGDEFILNGGNPDAGIYTYTLTVENAAGNSVSTSTSLEVINPPSYDLSIPASSVELDGVPNSTSTVGISISPNDAYSGNVRLHLGPDTDHSDNDDIPSILKDSDGNSLVEFSFATTTLRSGSSETTLTMKVLQPIRTDISPTIWITAYDESGQVSGGDREQSENFQLNANGFSPRTIEEF